MAKWDAASANARKAESAALPISRVTHGAVGRPAGATSCPPRRSALTAQPAVGVVPDLDPTRPRPNEGSGAAAESANGSDGEGRAAPRRKKAARRAGQAAVGGPSGAEEVTAGPRGQGHGVA